MYTTQLIKQLPNTGCGRNFQRHELVVDLGKYTFHLTKVRRFYRSSAVMLPYDKIKALMHYLSKTFFKKSMRIHTNFDIVNEATRPLLSNHPYNSNTLYISTDIFFHYSIVLARLRDYSFHSFVSFQKKCK